MPYEPGLRVRELDGSYELSGKAGAGDPYRGLPRVRSTVSSVQPSLVDGVDDPRDTRHADVGHIPLSLMPRKRFRQRQGPAGISRW